MTIYKLHCEAATRVLTIAFLNIAFFLTSMDLKILRLLKMFKCEVPNRKSLNLDPSEQVCLFLCKESHMFPNLNVRITLNTEFCNSV